MRILSNVERDRAARVETDSEVATVVELLDGAQLTVGYILFSVWGGELDAVAFTETLALPLGYSVTPCRRRGS